MIIDLSHNFEYFHVGSRCQTTRKLYIMDIAFIIDEETVYNRSLTMNELETERDPNRRTFVYRNNTQSARESFIGASPRRRYATRQRKSSMRRNSMLSRGDGKRAVWDNAPLLRSGYRAIDWSPWIGYTVTRELHYSYSMNLWRFRLKCREGTPAVTVRWCHPRLRVV